MGQQTASYRVRLARPDEVTRLQAIEDAAGRMFSGLGLIDEALDVSFPLDDLALLVGMGQVWVGCLEDDLPVGMVIASVREGAVYVEEMDVLPEHGRRGLGARLLNTPAALGLAVGFLPAGWGWAGSPQRMEGGRSRAGGRRGGRHRGGPGVGGRVGRPARPDRGPVRPGRAAPAGAGVSARAARQRGSQERLAAGRTCR